MVLLLYQIPSQGSCPLKTILKRAWISERTDKPGRVEPRDESFAGESGPVSSQSIYDSCLFLLLGR